ncbi:hypothetical protein TNCV_4039561 [Trichonephila clavipes]|nr:hypothetical protein TNCV_4039561 [Trichonephila clavipes]
MCKAVIHFGKRKLLRGIDVSEKAGKVSKMTNAMDVHKLPTPLETLKRFLRRYVRTGLKTIADLIGIFLTTCQRISSKDLNMHMVCQHIVPRMLNEDLSTAEFKIMAKKGFQRGFDERFTSDGKSVLLLKGLISKEGVLQQFNQ